MAIYEVVVDNKRCKGCAICVKVCPKQSIETGNSFNEAGYYSPVFKEGAECTGCGACVKLCPDFAITVYECEEVA